MALRRTWARASRRSFALALALAVVSSLLGLLPLPGTVSPAWAEDARVEKLRRLNERILAERGQAETASDERAPADDAVEAARIRLAMLEAQLAEKRLYGANLADPREALAARSQALGAKVAGLQEENRKRVAAVYRSAKVGAVAAGWQVDRARSARLSRYLAAIAVEQAARLEVLEVEHGSAIAALDRARAEDTQLAEQLRVLEVEVADARAGLDRALAGGGMGLAGSYPSAGSVVVEGAPYGRPWNEGDQVPEHPAPLVVAGQADQDLERMADLVAGEEPPAGGESILEQERMRLEEAARAARDRAEVEADGVGDVASVDGDDASAAETSEELGDDEAGQPGEETAAAADPADDDGAVAEDSSEVAKEDVAEAPSDGDDQIEAEDTDPAQPADDTEPADAPGPPIDKDEQAEAAEDSSDDDARGSTSGRRRGLLSRLFGDDADQDRESDAFAGARGTLPAPVAGKVVANYGQQHKSGATYRGVILRAVRGDPVEAVHGGKVSFAGPVPGLGNAVIVSHGGRYHTVYARLGDLDVREGQKVKPGARLGQLPDDNADMHFELRDQGRAVDPLPWLGSRLPGAPPE